MEHDSFVAFVFQEPIGVLCGAIEYHCTFYIVI